MRLRITFVFLLLFFGARAQMPPGYAPVFKTFNARMLSHALTDRFATDSEKVRSIYLWETRHIRYDVKNYQRGRSSYDAPKLILRHRRAVCLGYSILFDSLCYYADINSEMVPGYTRPPWYEPKDTLYLDDHAWNVVQVDGDWKLMDVTWASGYVAARPMIIRKILYLLIRFPFRQKYKFVKHRNDVYFESDPDFFVQQHLPSTYAWQTLSCSVPIDSFQYSPAAVNNCLDGKPAVCINGNDSIGKIEAEPKCRRQVEMGKQALHANPFNHQDLSLGYSYYSLYLLNQAEDENADKPGRIVLYDSTAHQLDSAARFFVRAAADSKHELYFLLARNKRLQRMVIADNKNLVAHHAEQRKAFRQEFIDSRKLAGKLKLENNKLRSHARTINKRTLHIKRPTKIIAGESAIRKELYNTIERNNDMIDSIGMLLPAYKVALMQDTLELYDTTLGMERIHIKTLRSVEGSLWVLRRFGLYNNYDTIVMNTLKFRMEEESRIDSLDSTIVKCNYWRAAELNEKYREGVFTIDSLILVNLDYCSQIAQLSESDLDEYRIFNHQQDMYSDWQDSLMEENRQLREAYMTYAAGLKRMKLSEKLLVWFFHLEVGAERTRVAMTNASFRHYYSGVFSTFKRDAHHCIKLRAHCRYMSSKLKREVAYEEKKQAQQNK